MRNMAVWIGVRGMGVEGGGGGGDDEVVVGGRDDGDDVGGCEEGAEEELALCETWRWTSSFSTRPSLPLPVTSVMEMLCSLIRWRTAGVAREACLPGIVSALLSDCRPNGPPISSFSIFCSACCGSSFFFSGVGVDSPVLLGVSASLASSSGLISLCMSMSTSGCYASGIVLYRRSMRPPHLAHNCHIVGLVM